MELLSKINSPEDLRKLNTGQLPQVVEEVRNFILDTISQKGGHFASNLGAVELTVALHYVFETPKDKIVWDVGHQSYPHKILTGRRDQFHTIRQKDGLAGFTARSESPYDHFGAGHASTALSSALGMAEAMRLKKDPHMAIAVVGDGSLTGGLVYEAMNNAGHIPAKNLLFLFNDNEMSIDPNVGALSQFINRTVTNPGYNKLRKDLVNILAAISEHGLPVQEIAKRVRGSVKNFFTPGMLFECFGFRYLGPINGHDIFEILDTLNFVKQAGPEGGPYLIHALTTKGRGYKLAEDNPVKYHGVGAFKICDGIQSKPKKIDNYQDVFADTLIELAKEDQRILGITAAMPSGTGLVKFQKEFPDRCYDVGIAEAHAVLFAAGLATEGMRPVTAIYSTFLQRAFDQVIHDVGIQNLPVIFCLDRAGMVGADGATHQGAYDLSYLRSVPNFVVMAPKDENELRRMLLTAIRYDKAPTAIRYPRGPVVGVPKEAEIRPLKIGEGELIEASGDTVDILLVAIGYAVQSAVEAAQRLKEEGYSVAVINARFVKPLDERLLAEWIPASKLVVTIEENTVVGGFGSAVLEFMSQRGIQQPTLVLGMPDAPVEHASQAEQRESYGIDGAGIAKQAVAQLQRLEGMPAVETLFHRTHDSELEAETN
ncbi:MAG: 1-deoxy-D-xylulose-5-phosphate synthase [Bdellovibrionales bacterium]|nr:1-deoxy-D-xylulose-5-phosphate synthase [Bdellovibrionales bacterium]